MKQITITGGDDHFYVLLGGNFGDGAENVIGFVTFGFKDGDVEGGNHFADAFDLCSQIVGHLLACAFVFFIKRVAECCAHIKTHSEIIGFLLFDDVEEDGGEAVRASRWLAAFGDPASGVRSGAGEGEVSAIGEGVTVNEVEGGHSEQ